VQVYVKTQLLPPRVQSRDHPWLRAQVSRIRCQLRDRLARRPEQDAREQLVVARPQFVEHVWQRQDHVVMPAAQ
jgi:hypothetical protein